MRVQGVGLKVVVRCVSAFPKGRRRHKGERKRERVCECVLARREPLDDAAGDSERDKNEIRWGKCGRKPVHSSLPARETLVGRGLLAHSAAHGFI